MTPWGHCPRGYSSCRLPPLDGALQVVSAGESNPGWGPVHQPTKSRRPATRAPEHLSPPSPYAYGVPLSPCARGSLRGTGDQSRRSVARQPLTWLPCTCTAEPVRGFEPRTSRLRNGRSGRLSYTGDLPAGVSWQSCRPAVGPLVPVRLQHRFRWIRGFVTGTPCVRCHTIG